MNNINVSFPLVMFQSTLPIIAIFYAIFLYAYALYTEYTYKATPGNPIREPIVGVAQATCKLLSILIIICFLGVLLSFIFFGLTQNWSWEWFVGALPLVSIGVVAGVSFWWAFWK